MGSLDSANPSWYIDGDDDDRSLSRTFADTAGPDTADVEITFCRGTAVKAFGFRIDPVGGVFEIRVAEVDGSITVIGTLELVGSYGNFSFDDISRRALLRS